MPIELGKKGLKAYKKLKASLSERQNKGEQGLDLPFIVLKETDNSAVLERIEGKFSDEILKAVDSFLTDSKEVEFDYKNESQSFPEAFKNGAKNAVEALQMTLDLIAKNREFIAQNREVKNG
jgi:hypothetical protein